MTQKGKQLGLTIIIALAIISSLAVSGILNISKTLTSTGSIKSINVEVYQDPNCTQTTTNIEWGVTSPGDTISKTVYIKNTGNYPMNLNITYTNWNPTNAGNYLNLTWDREGDTIDPGEALPAELTLDVDGSITGITDYTFLIIIQGTG